MFSAIGRHFQKKEINAFVECLQAQDGRDIAISLIMATAYRNNVYARNGIDFFTPAFEVQNDPKLLLELGLAIRDKQKSKEYEMAGALMIWLHTIRSVSHPSLRGLGRNLWLQLSRGMPHVPEIMTENVIPLMIKEKYPTLILDMRGYDQFPMGLTPEPLP